MNIRWNRTSFFGLAGYKGTISTNVTLGNGIPICFIASHFIPGEKNYRQRIKQYKNSIDCMFQEESIDGNGIVIWSGDLNSRIECLGSFSDVLDGLNSTEEPKMFVIISFFECIYYIFYSG